MFYLEGFKGFARAELDVLQPLTLLIDPNGSGKSNAIEGLELFSFVVNGGSLHQISELGRGGAFEIRGGLEGCPRYGQPAFTIGLRASRYFDGTHGRIFSYQVTVAPGPQVRIIQEKLALEDGTMIFETVEGTQNDLPGSIRMRFNDFTGEGRKSVVDVSDSVSLLSQYEKAVQYHSKLDHCTFLVSEIMNELRPSFVLDPVPRLIRGYERIGNKRLFRNGSNLSAVLHALDQGDEEDRRSLQRILAWIQQIPEEPYAGIDFVTTSLNDVIFRLVENPDKRFVDARLLSDCTMCAVHIWTRDETLKAHEPDVEVAPFVRQL